MVKLIGMVFKDVPENAEDPTFIPLLYKVKVVPSKVTAT